jgi:hypothetical protein
MNRRTLLKSTGSAILLLGVSRLAGAHDGQRVKLSEDNLIVESGPGQLVTSEFAHHHHTLEIPLNNIMNPPRDGVNLHTDWAQFRNPLANIGKHYHSVQLSYDQLVLISQGEQVIVEDSVKDHKFTLRLK